MKINNKLILAIATILVLSTNQAMALEPSSISNIYVFGDSLSDCGFMDKLQTDGHPNNTYTTPNGLTWSQQLGKDYGRPLTPNNDYKLFMQQYPGEIQDPGVLTVSQTLDGNCYAAGGATTSGEGLGMQGIYVPPAVDAQVKNYLLQHNNAADPNALYIIWAGANNILKLLIANDTTPADYAKASATAASDIVGMVDQLHAAGAKHIIVISLPNLSDTALIKQEAKANPMISQMTLAVSVNFNTGLNNALAGKGVLFFDMAALINNVVTHVPYTDPYAGTEITNADNSACDIAPGSKETALTCIPKPGTDNYLFEDGMHPTATAHNIIAKQLEHMIQSSNF